MSTTSIKATALGRTLILEPLSNRFDTSSLSQRPNITVMFHADLQQAPSVYRTEEFQRRVREWLLHNNYDPKLDVFVLSGRLNKIAIALATIMAEYPTTGIKIAIFDSISGTYVDRTLV